MMPNSATLRLKPERSVKTIAHSSPKRSQMRASIRATSASGWARASMSASQDRLEQLIARRLEAGADKEQIDARIWDLFGEQWAVMFTDLAGFSRNVAEFGIIHFLQVIHESERVLAPCIDEHDGILLKLEGDSMLVIFRRAARALDCAIAMQRTLQGYNVGKSDTERVLLCVGLGYGEMLRIGDNDV